MTGHTAWFRRFAGHRTATLMDRHGRAAARAARCDYPDPTHRRPTPIPPFTPCGQTRPDDNNDAPCIIRAGHRFEHCDANGDTWDPY